MRAAGRAIQAIGVILAALWLAPAAAADFGLLPGDDGFEVTATTESGSRAERAGSHPFALTTEVNFNLAPESPGEPGVPFADGDVRDVEIDLPAGLVENPRAVSQCFAFQFHAPRQDPFEESLSGESCPGASQIGTIEIRSSHGGGQTRTFGLFNLVPSPGAPSQIGFAPYGTPIAIVPRIRESGREYGLTLRLRDFPQTLSVTGFTLRVWGVPWSVAHDGERGNCLNEAEPAFPNAKCSVGSPKFAPRKAYLTLPTSCAGAVRFGIRVTSWQQSGRVERVSESPPLQDCEGVPFEPKPLARLDTDRTTSPSGYDFTLEGNDEHLTEPHLRAASQVKRAIVTLPAGMTINPSVGSGLGVCTPVQYAAETVTSAPGAGCPNASKIGELVVKSPIFDGEVKGGMFLAQPDLASTPGLGAENPFDSMVALYLIAKAPARGVMVRVAGKVDADPGNGRLVATFDDLPQLPYSHFNVRFRDGQRSPLATPSSCGIHATRIELAPWKSPGDPVQAVSQHELKAGIGGGPCPNGSTPPFNPGAATGMLNRQAGSHTPFYLHLSRTDPEQEIVSYSAQLPPGLTGKIKGIPYCPEAAIEAAKRRTGTQERDDPSCPEASRIGRTFSGYGLSSVLAYAPGSLYLAGPYRGSTFSIVAINSALVGPFDLGVVAVRSAIRVDRRSAQVSVDSTGSDPIPHILDGVPIHLRDVRVYIDRPELTLNPTSCERFSALSILNGSGAAFSDPADDSLASVASPFQVSNCSALGFRPTLEMRLKGGTKRGDNPAFRAVLRPRPGDANIARVAVTLPRSLFLAQGNIKTICTMTQFNARRCPPGSVYGKASAITPLLGEPMRGPVYLRSSTNQLPDLVAALEGGGVQIDVVGRIDSDRGGLRGTFDVLPDAPVRRFTMDLFGGRRSPLEAADNLCRVSMLAKARMIGHNNRGFAFFPKVRPSCKKKKRGRR